jgi:hypothetical protein
MRARSHFSTLFLNFPPNFNHTYFKEFFITAHFCAKFSRAEARPEHTLVIMCNYKTGCNSSFKNAKTSVHCTTLMVAQGNLGAKKLSIIHSLHPPSSKRDIFDGRP